MFSFFGLIPRRAERLKHAIAHGRIPHDLLDFYFRKGQKYYYLDDNDDFVREPTTLLYLLIQMKHAGSIPLNVNRLQ